jgi:murein DD-endopeptidase MepM/ murein hydrolase activator NlpD
MRLFRPFRVWGIILALSAAACQPAGLPTATPVDSAVLAQAMTPIPTLALRPTETHESANLQSTIFIETTPLQVEAVSTESIPSTPTIAATFAPTIESIVIGSVSSATTESDTPPPTAFMTSTPLPALPRIDHYLFARPFPRSDALIDYLDRTYPYGSTQGGAREVHLGVDYANVRHTTILAIGAGTVVFAGPDSSVRLGPAYDYYGNTVLVKHDTLSPEGLPVYTLYGHMEKINVKVDQYVTPGDPVGTVGDSGIAIGPHLHLEVRVGGDGHDYRTTRNPDLWIAPYPGYGTIAGRVTSAQGMPVYSQLVLIRTETRPRETYTYGERVNGDAVWQENFAMGDLPAGSYDVLISDNGNVRFRETVSVRDGQTTFVEIVLED